VTPSQSALESAAGRNEVAIQEQQLRHDRRPASTSVDIHLRPEAAGRWSRFANVAKRNAKIQFNVMTYYYDDFLSCKPDRIQRVFLHSLREFG
jgi:hypothetical protein